MIEKPLYNRMGSAIKKPIPECPEMKRRRFSGSRKIRISNLQFRLRNVVILGSSFGLIEVAITGKPGKLWRRARDS
ncbi:MAG: hypothetical protein KAI38_10270, partial [Candidatus Latescibacteria bacterium]|nr:hypothetical protein [Candidatus Latescibacterota bacterium]